MRVAIVGSAGKSATNGSSNSSRTPLQLLSRPAMASSMFSTRRKAFINGADTDSIGPLMKAPVQRMPLS